MTSGDNLRCGRVHIEVHADSLEVLLLSAITTATPGTVTQAVKELLRFLIKIFCERLGWSEQAFFGI